MQHDGWLETLLHSRFPKHDLVFRNLGFAGDELTIRLRSDGLRQPGRVADAEQGRRHLRLLRLQRVVRRRGGAAASSSRTSTSSSSTRSARSTTARPPRGWCSSRRSPTRTSSDRNLPDGSENNERLELYTDAMAEVAKANGVPFVDLFTPDAGRCTRSRNEPLTINGIHLNEHGNQLLAEIIDQRPVRRQPQTHARPTQLETAPPGGQRQELPLVPPLPHDRRLLDLRRPGRPASSSTGRLTTRSCSARWKSSTCMTANRDKRVWAVAQGERPQGRRQQHCRRSSRSITNKPGPLPGGKHVFLERRGSDRAR